MAAIYRRICLLRCAGHRVEAGKLERDELARALQQIASTTGETPAFVTFRDGLFALECERVHQAQAVAELLAPMLAERLGRLPATPHPQAPASRPSPARAPADIADMIDTLLAQQTAPSAP